MIREISLSGSLTSMLPVCHEFPGVRSVEMAHLNQLSKARLEIVEVDAVLAAWLGDERLPMGGAPARPATHSAQRPVAPDVFGRVARVSFDPDRSQLVVRP